MTNKMLKNPRLTFFEWQRIFWISLLLFSSTTFAQNGVDVENVTDAQIEQFLKEASARGMSEAQIEAAAKMNGYTAIDIATIREKINRVKTGISTTAESDNQTTREQIGEVAERTTLEVSDSTKVTKKVEVFGKHIFNNENLTFEPNLRLPTPKNYILGPDDGLKVDISGYASQHYDVTISPEGTVRFESLAPVYVNGLSIEEAKVKIVNRLKLIFGGLRNGSLTADVTLGDIRSIQVTLVGEVEKPGTYTLSSLAKVFNALYQSGGPTDKGTFRDIKIIRDDREISRLDLYSFLTKGVMEGNIALHDQDIVFVGLANKKVELTGELKREGIFELSSDETLEDAIGYAGGFSDQAYQDELNITRNTRKEKKLLTVSDTHLSNFALKNGDKIYVGAILDRFENRVEVLGAVFRPGEFALGYELKTVEDLINKAEGFREDAFLNRVLLIREKEDLDQEIINLDLSEGYSDMILQKNDQLLVKSIVELRELRTIEIIGAVNQPGEYEFSDGMDVQDLIVIAGGFSEGASTKRIEVAKRLFNDESSDATVEVFDYETSGGLKQIDHEIVLSPFDKIFVRDLPNYEVQKLVHISGEVNYPGVYTILKREERISDLIQRAGGLRKESYAEGARFYREGDLVALDLKKALSNAKDLGNLILSEGDSLIIPKVQEVVKLSGQVLNPTIVAFQPEMKFQDYLSQAGGVTDSAFVRKAYVRYANGLTDRTHSFLGIKKYPDIQRGMEVMVPKRNRVRMTSAERIAIGSGFVSLSAVLLTLFRLF